MVLITPRDEPYGISRLGDPDTNTPLIVKNVKSNFFIGVETQFGPVNTLPSFGESFKDVDWKNPLKLSITNYGEDATIYMFQVRLR